MIEVRKNKMVHIYIIIIFLVLMLSTAFFIMYKYYVEGEKNLPFSITKLIVVSSANTDDLKINENGYEANVVQKNDIYIAIEKNGNYFKNDAIKKIKFNNFKILKQNNIGEVKIYRTSQNEKNFEYIDEYEIKDEIEYIGAQETNLKLENMTLSNQGGLIEISTIIDELGKFTYLENEDIISDGTLLNRIGLKSSDIQMQLSFDMIMELEGGNTFKTTVTLEIPSGNIESKGVCTREYTNLSKLVYKRN